MDKLGNLKSTLNTLKNHKGSEYNRYMSIDVSKAKPCPGLDGIPCGEARAKGQGYCRAHVSQYRKNRKKQMDSGTYQPRPYNQWERHTDRCAVCDSVKPGKVLPIKNSVIPPICADCGALLRNFSLRHITKLVDFFSQSKNRTLLESGELAYIEEYQRRVEVYRLRSGWDTFYDAEAFGRDKITKKLDDDLAKGLYFFDTKVRRIVKRDPRSFTYQELERLEKSGVDIVDSDPEVKAYYRNGRALELLEKDLLEGRCKLDDIELMSEVQGGTKTYAEQLAEYKQIRDTYEQKYCNEYENA